MSLSATHRATLPAYLQILRVGQATASPQTFLLALGVEGSARFELNVTGAQLYALSLADGSRTTRQIIAGTEREFPEQDRSDLTSWVSECEALGVLVDACARPDIVPGAKSRYARHELFFASMACSIDAQRCIGRASVAIIGVGGIGTWTSYLLAAGGVGRLVLVDGDEIEESNLTRQVLFDVESIGKKKVDVAREKLLAIRPDLQCEAICASIEKRSDLDSLLPAIDFIILSGNTPRSIYDWVDDYACSLEIPWTRAGYVGTSAVSGPLLVPGKTGCQRCVNLDDPTVLGTLPLIGEINRRHQVASFGPLNGIAAALTAKEVLCYLSREAGIVPRAGSVTVVDPFGYEMTEITLNRKSDCDRCSRLHTAH